MKEENKRRKAAFENGEVFEGEGEEKDFPNLTWWTSVELALLWQPRVFFSRLLYPNSSGLRSRGRATLAGCCYVSRRA